MAGDMMSDGGGGSIQPVFLKIPEMGELLQIFPTNYNQNNHCTMIGSPSESGQQQFDNYVIQPTKVQFTGILKCEHFDVVRHLRRMMKNHQLERLKCEFQTKAGKVVNMIIESCEEVGDASRYDAVELKVSLQEYLEHNNTAR